MNKEYRVKKNTEIELILKEKNSRSNQYFSVYKRTNLETSHFRYAMSVGKKIGNAVTRNKYKRITRNLVDQNKFLFKNDFNYIIILKKKCLELSYNELNDSLNKLLKEKLWKRNYMQ